MKIQNNFKVDHKDEEREIVVLQLRSEGFVTINFKSRGYALGYLSHAPRMSGYKGVGWKEQLANDAMAELRKIYDTPAKVEK